MITLVNVFYNFNFEWHVFIVFVKEVYYKLMIFVK